MCKSRSEPPTQTQPGFVPPVNSAASYSCKHGNPQRKPKIPTGNVTASTLQSLRIIYQQLQQQHCANRTTAESPEHLHGFMGEEKPTPKHKSLPGMMHLKIPTRFSRSEALEQEFLCLTGRGMRGESRAAGGTGVEAMQTQSWGGRQSSPIPAGTGSTGGTLGALVGHTHTAGTREQRGWERWEHGEEPVVDVGHKSKPGFVV